MELINIPEFQKAITDAHDDPRIDFINVCSTAEYNEKHIPGVRNVPLDTLSQHLPEFTTKSKIYVHCLTGNRGQKAIAELEKMGVTAELINVEGGLTAWQSVGLPTNTNTSRLPIMRQVLLIAGTLTVLGVITSLTIHPYFILLSLFVGCGLMFAGATGWCGMSFLLGKMPWNK